MKKQFSILMVIFMMSTVLITPALAQSVDTKAPGTWVSSINIQNVGDGDANSYSYISTMKMATRLILVE